MKNLKQWAPWIAIAVLAIGGVAANYLLVPAEAPPNKPDTPKQAPPAPAAVPPAASSDVPVAKFWSTYHGGPDMCGYSDAQFPDKPAILWRAHVDGAIRQPPVGDEAGIYVVTAMGLIASLDHTGKERWTKRLMRKPSDGGAETPERTDAPIACFRDTVFVGALSGKLYALNAQNGEPRWTYDVGAEILGTVNFHVPAEADEPARAIVIKRDDGALHCVNFDTGAALWQTRAVARTDGSLALANGVLAYGSCASALHFYTALDGRIINEIQMGADCQIASGPARVGDDVYSGSRCGRFMRINVRSGKTVWTNLDSNKEVFTTPAVTGDTVIFGSDDSVLFAVNRETGKLKWRFDTPRPPSSPIVANDKVFVASGGTLHLLALDTGKELWNNEVSDGIAAPAIVNGMVVVGSEDGSVVAFGNKQG